jgi:hypothetical protein
MPLHDEKPHKTILKCRKNCNNETKRKEQKRSEITASPTPTALGCTVLLGAGCAALLWAAVGCFSQLWAAVGCSGLLFAALVWACLALSKTLQAILGTFRGHLWLSGPFFWPSRGHLGAITGPLGAILAALGPSWDPPGAFLGHVKTLWELSWALLAKSTKMTPKRNPESGLT